LGGKQTGVGLAFFAEQLPPLLDGVQ